MALKTALVPIPLGPGGVDTRTDAKSIAPPKLARLENGRFTTPGALRKRKGSTRIAPLQNRIALTAAEGAADARRVDDALSDVKHLFADADNLYAVAGQGLLSYNDAIERWQHVAPLTSVGVEYGPVIVPFNDARNDMTLADVCSADGLTVMVGQGKASNAPTYSSCISVIDEDTGRVTSFRLNAHRPRVVAVGTTIIVFFTHTTSTNLYALPITRATMGDRYDFAAFPTPLATDLNASKLYDVEVSGGRVLLAYHSSVPDIKFGYVDVSGALDGALSTETPAAAISCLSCAVEPTTRIFGLMWGIDSTTSVIVRSFSEAKAALFAAYTLEGAAPAAFRNITGAWSSATLLHVFWETTAASAVNYRVHHGIVDSAGAESAGGEIDFLRHSGLASRAFVQNGRAYVMLVHESTLQSSYFLVRASNYLTSSILYVGSHEDDGMVVGRYFPGTARGALPFAHLGRVWSAGSNRWLWAACIAERLGDAASVAGGRAQLLALDFGAAIGSTRVGAATIVLGGSMLWRVEGPIATEHGFLLYPEGTTATPSNGAGTLTSNSTYQYRVYYEYEWPSGEKERSAAITVSAVLGATDDTVTLSIRTLCHTLKDTKSGWRKVAVVIYRKNPTGVTFHRLTSADPNANEYLSNNIAADTVSFVDEFPDATIASNEQDYLSGDPADLTHATPPPASVMAAGNNRVFVGGMADPNEVRPAMLRFNGEALEFSDELALSMDDGAGPQTGLATLSDALIVFRDHQIYIVGGDGPDNTGFGGEFTPPRIISDDVGCIDPRSIVRTPAGILFQSRKGIYLLGSDAGLRYVGADVEAYNGDEIAAAVALPDNHEVRFLMATRTLVYNYATDQWAVWTVGGVSACLWRNTHARLASDGAVYVESSEFHDDGTGYSLALETAWIRLGTMQGFQRVYAALLLGAWRSAHKLRVSVGYDYETGWADTFEWDPATVLNVNLYGDDATYGAETYGGDGASSVYQVEIPLRIQKCEAVRFRIEDIPDGTNPLRESYSASELTLEVGIKKGPFKLRDASRAR